MTDVFKRHGVNLFWTFGIFLAAFLFYAATSAFMPYPGASAEYFTALCFPGHAEALLTSALDGYVLTFLLKLVSPESIALVAHLLYAGIGALIVTCIFRSAIATTRMSCIDLTGIRENELDRVLFAISHISFESGLATALLALTALPVWAMATRPYPQALLALIAVAAITLALEFRWRVNLRHMLGLEPKWQYGIILGSAYALMGVGIFTFPALALVMLLPLLLSGGYIINPEAKGRGGYILCAGFGLLVGLGVAIGVTAGAASLRNLAQLPLPNAGVLWGQTFATHLAQLVPTFTAFESLAPLVFFLLAAALFLGCFPHAYLKFGTPFIGQLSCIGLGVATLLQWPDPIWALFEEPSALSLAAIFMMALCLGSLFGSWLHAFYNNKMHWSHAHVRVTALIATVFIVGAYTVSVGMVNAPAASGLPLRHAVQTVKPLLDELLPKQTRLWLTPDRDTLGIIARRYTEGRPVQPLAEALTTLTPGALKTSPILKDMVGNDPLVHRLATLGAEPLRQYLLVADEELGIMRSLPPQETALNAAKIAEQLHLTDFGQTRIGQRSITWLKTLAAREHAACAIGAEPEAAATHLRLARQLNPQNLGVPLSLVALANEGIYITQEERNTANDIVEARPSLKAPSTLEALNFEVMYGPVHTPGFCTASRLRRFHLGNAPAVLNEILHLYRTAPDRLSDTEKRIAVLHLPADEVATLLAERSPKHGDMELFFCLYPTHPATAPLYEKHQLDLADNDALNLLFSERQTRMRTRIPDKMQAFFLRDGTFAYALYYVNALLADKDYKTATQFVSGFNVRERLRKTPALLEELCYRVLNQLKDADLAEARTMCEAWLRSEPRQYRLWTLYLTQLIPAENASAEIETCLRYYPLHPIATAHYAEQLEKDLGPEAATRYRTAVKKATEAGSCLQKDSHAHRRL